MNDQATQSQSQTPLEENRLTPQAGPVDGDTEATPSDNPLDQAAGSGDVQPVGTDPADIDLGDDEENGEGEEEELDEE